MVQDFLQDMILSLSHDQVAFNFSATTLRLLIGSKLFGPI